MPPPATSVRSVHLDGNGAGGGSLYDQSLLATTPEVSRAAKQESYNVDLLEERPPTTHVLEGAGGPGGVMGLNGSINKEIGYSSLPTRGGQPPAPNEEGYYRPNRRPWYRRPVGIITIAIVSIVIVGAIVGGAVGGTVGRHKDSHQQQQTVGSTSPSVPNGQGSNSGQQGVGSVSPISSTSPTGSSANSSQSTQQQTGAVPL